MKKSIKKLLVVIISVALIFGAIPVYAEGGECEHTNTEFVETVVATCTEGNIGNIVCSACSEIVEENVSGAVEALGHTPETDDSVIVYSMNDDMHHKLCSVCFEEFDGEAHTGEFVQCGSEGHSGVCVVCGLQTQDIAVHNFGDDNVCDVCEWTCEEHDFVQGEIIQEGDCTTDEIIETVCSICGIAGENIVNAATGHSYDENNICTSCGKSVDGDIPACPSTDGVIDVLAYYPTEEDATAAGSESKYYDSKLDDDGELGTETDPIIIDSALELTYLTRYAGDATKGKYYKVADGIKGFDMSGGNINLDGTLEENLEAITTSGKRHDAGENFFQGHFDGNGATVYGLWSKYDETNGPTPQAAGLFAYTKGNVTIKNVGVSLSYLKAKNYAGGIVGAYALNTDFTDLTENQLTIENCSVTESHIETTTTGSGFWGTNGTGAIYGIARCHSGSFDGSILVNNCFINLDADHLVSKAVSGEKSLQGGIGATAVTTGAKFTNCVVLGITPYTTFAAGFQGNDVQHTGPAVKYTNIYTDAVVGSAVDIGFNNRLQDYTTCMTQLSADQMKGDAAIANMNLDWNVWLANPNGYPELRVAHKGATLTDNLDGTHSIACACGVYGAPSAHEFVDGVCECDAEFNCAAKKTIYWDGTVAAGFSSTGSGDSAEDPIIINNAAELAYLVKNSTIRDYSAGIVTSTDKYYKIADGIGAIVLQPKAYADEIMALDSAAAVEAYFSDTSKTFIEWAGCEGWEQGSFAGTFDGNGVTIYGLYGDPNSTNGNKGLFSTVDAGATFKNFTIKNAYLHTTKANFNVGAIACISCDGSYGDIGDGVVWADRCAVVNSYIRNDCDQWTRSGIMFGTLNGVKGEAAYFDNCLVYGNDAAYGSNDTPMAILGSAKNKISPDEATNIPEGLETVLASDNLYRSMVRNSIVIGATPYISAAYSARVNDKDSFVNVYTDAEVENAAANVTYEENQIKKLSAIDGATIAAEAKNLDWSNVWFAANGMPVFRSFHDAELTVVDNGDGTHTESCSCGLIGTVGHSYEYADEKHSCYGCGYVCNGEFETVAAVDKTCTEDGNIKYKKCNTCGLCLSAEDDTIILEKDTIIPASHKYNENNVCSVCGYNRIVDYLEYEISNNAVTIIGCDTLIAGAFVIPSEIDGYPVKTIGEKAFYNCNSLTNIVIPEGVLIINRNAFYSCDALESVTIPSSVKNIYANAFEYCENLNTVNISDINAWAKIKFDSIGIYYPDTAYCSANPLCYGADLYLNGELVTDLVIPDSLTEISVYAFVGCSSITSVTIPKSVTTIGSCAFYNCTALTDVIYMGNSSEWANVTVGTYNDPILLANKTYLGCEEHDWQDYEVIVEGDCTTDRVVVQKCTVCGETQTVTIAAIRHTAGDAVVENKVDATCTENGSYELVSYCTVCGTEVLRSAQVIASIGHTESAAIEENRVEPTCTADGSYDLVVYCSVCGEEISRTTETIAAIGHTESAAIEENRVEPTCTADGSHDLVVYCSVCGEEISRTTETIAAIGHTESAAVEENRVEPTCTADGSYDLVVYCSVCGEEISRTTETIAAISHSYVTKYDATNHWSECSVCGTASAAVTHSYTETATDSGTEYLCDCGYGKFIANATDSDNNVGVSADDNAFPAGTKIFFDLIDELHERFEAIKTILEDISSKYVVYDITPSKPLNDGAEAEISFAIPHGYGKNVSIYYVNEQTGKRERLETEIRDGRAYAKTNHFSTYALIDETEDATPTFKVETDAVAVTGTTVTMAIKVNGNPGVISMILDIAYDTSILELVSAEEGDYSGIEFSPTSNEVVTIVWMDPTGDNNVDDGTLALLTFNVKEDAVVGDTSITISYDENNVYNFDLDNVAFETEDATLRIVDYLAGDVNGDGEVSDMDTTVLKRYLAKWGVEIDERAADVNADGAVNSKDYTILCRYLCDWDVKLEYLY